MDGVDSQEGQRSGNTLVKLAVLLVVVIAFVVIYAQFGESLTLKGLAAYENELRAFERDHPWTVMGGALLLYVVVSGLSIPGGAVALSLVYGSYFGFLRAVVIVSFGSTAGATVAFLTSRYLFRNFIQDKFRDRLVSLNRNLEEEGAFYLFSLRLIAAVPFFMLNLVMGVTTMRTATYWWVSQLGMLPGTMAYVYAGTTLRLPVLAEEGFQGLGIEFLIAFAILGMLPFVVKRLIARSRKPPSTPIAT